MNDERKRPDAVDAIQEAWARDLLSTLRRHGAPYAMSPGELREASMVTAGAVTQRVARAEAVGLVATERGPRGRTSSVRLTAAGHRLIEDSVGELLAYEDSLLDHLGDEERERLTALLRRLLDGLAERLGADGKPGQVGDG